MVPVSRLLNPNTYFNIGQYSIPDTIRNLDRNKPIAFDTLYLKPIAASSHTCGAAVAACRPCFALSCHKTIALRVL